MNTQKQETILHRIAFAYSNNELYPLLVIDEETGEISKESMELFYTLGVKEEHIDNYMKYSDAPMFLMLDIREINYLNTVFENWEKEHSDIPMSLYLNLHSDTIEEKLNKILDN